MSKFQSAVTNELNLASAAEAIESSDTDLAMIRDEARKALSNQSTDKRLRGLLDEQSHFDRALWDMTAQLGWLGISIPEPMGGSGMDLAARCVIAEEIGRVMGSVPFTVTTCVMSALMRHGNADHQMLVPAGAAGRQIFTLACFESGESTPRAANTIFDGDRVSGEKVVVPAGAFAHQALVTCRDNVVVLADLDQPGVRREVCGTIDNSRGYARLSFDRALARPLAANDVLPELLDELAIVTAFEQIGGAEACLYSARDYALQRRAFGQPIGAFQAVKHELANFYVLIQIARGAAFSAIDAQASERPLAAACARLAAMRAYDHTAQEAIQLHGAIGATWEANQHLHFRRARCLAQEWGGVSIWRERLLKEVLELGSNA